MEYIKFSLSRDLLYFSIFAGIIGFLFYKLGMDWTFTPETIFTCLAVAVIIGIILCIFVPRRRERKNEAAFFHFCRLLKLKAISVHTHGSRDTADSAEIIRCIHFHLLP